MQNTFLVAFLNVKKTSNNETDKLRALKDYVLVRKLEYYYYFNKSAISLGEIT